MLLVDPADLSRLADSLRAADRERLRVPPWRIVSRLREGRRIRREAAERQAVVRVALNRRCIPAQLAAFFGGHAAPCGICSACVGRGQPAIPPPDLRAADPDAVRRWALRWQREALAARMDCSPEAILSDEGLAFAVSHRRLRPGTFAPDAEEALLRLLKRA